MYTYTYAQTCAHRYSAPYVWTYVHTCINTHTSVHTYTNIRIHTYMHAHTNAYIHAQMHTIMYTYTHERSQIHTNLWNLQNWFIRSKARCSIKNSANIYSKQKTCLLQNSTADSKCGSYHYISLINTLHNTLSCHSSSQKNKCSNLIITMNEQYSYERHNKTLSWCI